LEFRKIRIALRDATLVATTREGYYVAKPDVPAVVDGSGQLSQQGRFNLAAASQGLMVFDGIPLTITRDQATPDHFHLAFPAASLNLKDDGSKMIGNVSLIVLSFDRTGKLLNRSGQVISLHLARLQSGKVPLLVCASLSWETQTERSARTTSSSSTVTPSRTPRRD